jgi:predicted PurR-regulated permease PerM
MDAVSGWLKAQGVSMVFVGIFTGVALGLVGIPAAPALGLVAGLCEFVPYLGTIVVAVPAILIGFSISPETGIWTIVVIVIVQQVQGNIVTPLVQSSMAELPPALTIFSLIAAGILLGPMGVILAVPLTVVAQTLVKELVHYDETAGATPVSAGKDGSARSEA